MSSERIGEFLQEELQRRSLSEVAAVEAARWLDRTGLLLDDEGRPGKPLRQLMRDGEVHGAEQRPPKPNGRWFVVRQVPASDTEGGGVVATNTDAREEPSEITDARARYRPDEVKLLLIGESRPAGGTFFYLGNSILFAATREAFLRARPDVDPQKFLAAFKVSGCYLEDLCPRPVNQLANPERRAARVEAIPDLATRIEHLKPQVIIVVMQSIEDEVRAALFRAALDSVPTEIAPFPRKRYRDQYVREMSQHFRRWIADG